MSFSEHYYTVSRQGAAAGGGVKMTSPLSMVTTREEGSTLCSVGRTVLVMSDMKARLTSRVVPPYTSYTLGTQWQGTAAAW